MYDFCYLQPKHRMLIVLYIPLYTAAFCIVQTVYSILAIKWRDESHKTGNTDI
jgi:hypothetical protein